MTFHWEEIKKASKYKLLRSFLAVFPTKQAFAEPCSNVPGKNSERHTGELCVIVVLAGLAASCHHSTYTPI